MNSIGELGDGSKTGRTISLEGQVLLIFKSNWLSDVSSVPQGYWSQGVQRTGGEV